MPMEESAKQHLDEVRKTNSLPANVLEDPSVHSGVDHSIPSRSNAECTAARSRNMKHKVKPQGGCTPRETLTSSDTGVSDTANAECTAAKPKQRKHKVKSRGECTPRETQTLDTKSEVSNKGKCDPETPVGCTTQTFPSYIEDPLQLGAVGCTTINPQKTAGNAGKSPLLETD